MLEAENFDDIELLEEEGVALEQWVAECHRIGELHRSAAEAFIMLNTWRRFRHSMNSFVKSRVAMAATVGWIINEAGITFDGDIASGVSFASLGKGVQAWENVPDAGKLQILLAAGAIETASEFQSPHYMKGGKLGAIPGPFGLRLWDPVGLMGGLDEETKANKRQMELNNGRLAMIGAASMFAASYIDGSVPALPDSW